MNAESHQPSRRLAVPAACLAACLAAGCSPRAAAGSAVGDAGHYLICQTRVFLHNPAGRAFRVTVHRFPWWIGHGWNVPVLGVRLTGPGGKVVVDKRCTVGDGGYALDVAAGAKGTYALDVMPGNGLNYWYVTSSLDRAVAWTGPTTGDALEARWFASNPFVPRRWAFWVPKDARRFVVRAQNNSARSQREDHGLTILSPRGQRIAVLWGQANPDAKEVRLGKVRRRVQRADVLVEPGTAGRFWAIEVRQGDSHTYNDVNFCLEGVPPYLARSPEEWFDANAHRPAPVECYDESHFVQSDRPEKERKDLHQHWTPCPSLGDPDSCELRCPARIALWNPEGRALKFVIGTYLPRNLYLARDKKRPNALKLLPDEKHDHAVVTVKEAGGKTVLKDRAPLKHLHDPRHPGFMRTLRGGKGVLFVDVAEAEHFWAYTYPATPAVMIGKEIDGGWRRFAFEIGTARNWYFLVPRGTKRFTVRASAARKTDVMDFRVNAPDRTVAAFYGNAGEKTVTVPAGLGGKVWHVRIDFGSATRFISSVARPRFPSLDVTLDLKGVPGYLAPTWEQWFDPTRPRAPHDR